MHVIETDLQGVVILEPQIFGDHRGYFFESFSQREFAEKVCETVFVQDNESKSSYGVLRGLHYQLPPHAQSKLVRVIRGRDLWALLLLPAAYLAAFSLLFIEGKATLYRSAQFLPVFCGYGALLFVYGIWQLTGTLSPKAKNTAGRKISAGVRALAVLVLAVILWNQCMDMTRWFYITKVLMPA